MMREGPRRPCCLHQAWQMHIQSVLKFYANCIPARLNSGAPRIVQIHIIRFGGAVELRYKRVMAAGRRHPIGK
jgi:hypothetical protein